MKRIGLLFVIALVGFACADGVGNMLEDAGQMIEDAGVSMQDGSVPDAGAQVETVTCNKSETVRRGDAVYTYRWAEYDVDPGVTEVTHCHRGGSNPPNDRDHCFHGHAPFFHGTSTGFMNCGLSIDYDDPGTPDIDNPDPISITVHR